MNGSVEAAGIVLSAMPTGEYDKRLVLLTREYGKITAFARGARRSGSALMAASNPFVFGTFTLIPGRDAYTLTGASVKNYFIELAQDQNAVYYGFYFLELAGYYGRENLDGTDMLNLLYLTLRALQRERPENALVRRIYEIRMMTVNGDFSPEESAVSGSLLYVLQHIAGAPLPKLFSFELEKDLQRELEQYADHYMARVLDRRMKSLEVLKQMTSGE